MTFDVLALVLCSAVLHAGWNALVKLSADRMVSIAIMMAAQTAVALLAVGFVSVPPPAAWASIAASAAFHTGYLMCLIAAYRQGDLSLVYPLARGSAPVLVALSAATLMGETLTTPAMISIALIAAGIVSLVLTRATELWRQPGTALFALGTGVCIAGYTLADGIGARLSGSALDYILWLSVFNGLPTILVALVLRRGQIVTLGRGIWKMAALSGLVSMLAYGIVLWAMRQAPMGLVSALREVSVVIAVLIGVAVLKERLTPARMLSILVTVAGVALLKASS